MMYWNAIVLALREMRRNVLRSSLTILGIVIGVASVITMVTIGEGATAQVQAGSPAPEEAEPPAPERAEPTSVTAFAAITEVVGVADAAPHGEAPHAAVPGAAAPGDLVDSGVAQQENGAALDPGAPTDVPSPGVAAPLSGPERGTNGALIFD